MKKLFVRIGAMALASAVLAGSVSLSSYAVDRSYSYNYDYWGDVQDSPDFYEPCKTFTWKDLNLDKKISNPQGLTADGDFLYLCDSGNNRIIKMKRNTRESLEVVEIYDHFNGKSSDNTFNTPTDLAISEDGNIFIADKGNARIIKVDKDFNYLMEFGKPNDSSIDKDLAFAPTKLVVDTAERVYAVAAGINKGLLKYESDGTFTNFHGAPPASYNFVDYIWKKFASQEQLMKMESFVPTEYSNCYINEDGFIYAVAASVAEEDLKGATVQNVRLLNLLGSDILVRNGVYYDGKYPVYGDLYMGSGGGMSGPSQFIDVTSFPNEVFVCLDKNRGRLFSYDNQGRLLFCCGGNGNMDGYFRNPIALDHIGYDIYVLDQLDCAITVFTLTNFGELVFTAMEDFDAGRYNESLESWNQVIKYDGNYDLAYIGIGRAYLRQKEYKTAMEYFKLKYDAENYSKAYRQYRKIWVEENIVVIVIVLLVLFLVPMIIGKIKSIKYEFATADIFKV
ncbi:NHL repeat-containing protein [Lachnospiraceae bacterium YSD2013]|nr:NHL repeat-containing protein [Lachnospiraceae bacterium YSD2013]